MTDRKIDIGDVAPDFTLKDQNEGDVTLSDFRAEKDARFAAPPGSSSGRSPDTDYGLWAHRQEW